MAIIEEYKQQIMSLNRNRNSQYGMAPHKPILLLAVLDEIERGHISHGFISLTPELLTAFSERWRSLVRPNTWNENIAMPFRHMAHEAFWSLVKNGVAISPKMLGGNLTLSQLRTDIDGALLPSDLWDLLQECSSIETLRKCLLTQYFTHMLPNASPNTPNDLMSNEQVSLMPEEENKPQVKMVQVNSGTVKSHGARRLPENTLIPLDDLDSLNTDTSLAKALLLSTNMKALLFNETIAVLELSVRPTNCLENRGIRTLGQLVSLTIQELYEMPAMGRKSIREIITSLRNAMVRYSGTGDARYRSAREHFDRTKDDWLPLTLQHEWEVFSWNADTRLPLALLNLPLDAYSHLSLDINGDLDQLLDWKWDDVRELLGDDTAEEVLSEIISFAQVCRAIEPPRVTRIPASLQEQREILENRWGQCLIAGCGLSAYLTSLLHKIEILRFSQLIDAVSSLHPVLQLDVTAFVEIWNYLVSIGLREGDAFAEWKRLRAEHPSPISLEDVVEEIHWGCKEKQWNVLNMRYGLLDTDGTAKESKVHTLEEVAQYLDLTRERVRQIEYVAIRELKKAPRKLQDAFTRLLLHLIAQKGDIASLTDLASEIVGYISAQSVDAVALCRLLLEQSEEVQAVQRGNIYCLKRFPSAQYSLVVERARRVVRGSMETLSDEDISTQVLASFKEEDYDMSPNTIIACLRASGRFDTGYQPKDLNYHLVETLRNIGHPAHFTEIAAQLNASGWRRNHATDRAVGARLGGERDLFVFVDKGTYGLVEWGSEDKRIYDRRKNGLIGDIVEEYLTERDEPVETGEIIKVVLSQKRCQEFSVLQRLSTDERFHAFERGKYGLKKWVM